MLSAFTARPIVELKPKEKVRIESLLAYGDRLLVGLNNGTLRVYRVHERSPPASPAAQLQAAQEETAKEETVELLNEQERFSRYKIEQLAYIKEIPLLISLSNGQISFHDPSSYAPQETLAKSKGASVFAVTSNVVQDEATGVPSIVSRLAVAVKRRLLLWSWHDSELADDGADWTLVTGIKSLTWVTGTRLVVGLTGSYVLVDVESGEVKDIQGPGSIGGAPGQDSGRFGGVGVASMGYMGMGGMVPRPLATRLSEGEVLLAKDINTHFIDTDGEALGRRQIPWAVAPEAIGYSYPYLLALQPARGTLEIRNPETLGALQSISLPNATMMHVPNPYVSLAHAGKGFLVSSEKCIWRMDALGYDAQIDVLIEVGQYDEAISLLGMLEDALLSDKDGRTREAKMLKAQGLFDKRKYRASLDLFTEALAPPERVIGMYPEVISGDLNAGDGTQEEDNDKPDHPKSPIKKALRTSKDPTDEGSESSKEEAPTKSKQDLLSPAPDNSDTTSILSYTVAASFIRRKLEGKDLHLATTELLGFLVDARTQLQRRLNFDGTLKTPPPSTPAQPPSYVDILLSAASPSSDQACIELLLPLAQLVDTTLFRAYMLSRPTLAGALFRLPNFCAPSVVKEKLLETKRYVDLVDFFHGKRMHDEALAMLLQFGRQGEGTEVAKGRNSKDDEEVPEQLKGPQRTVAYLQSLGPEDVDLVLRYSVWPLKKEPELGMQIFLADTENAETLPRERVVRFLRDRYEEGGEGLERIYLEHVVNELDDKTPAFHQRLVDVYLERLRKGEEGVLEKLLDFLRESGHYEAWSVLRGLDKEDPNLFEARAIILGKMGQHRQALSIYVFDMEDAEKAEEYCNQVYISSLATPPTTPSKTSTLPASETIYHTLLSLYLTPSPPHQPSFEPAISLLSKHGSRLPASSTLGLIPESLPVKNLEEYFTTRIRAANSIVSQMRVVAGLRKTVNVGAEVELRLGNGGRDRCVVISDERVCGVCHKRFHGGTAIKVLPSNAVVHYGCSVR